MNCKIGAKYFIIISYLVFMCGCGKSVEEKDLLTQLKDHELVLQVEFIDSETQQFNVQTYLFRYKSDDCEVEAYISVPNEYIENKGQYPCIVFNRGGNRDFSANTSAPAPTPHRRMQREPPRRGRCLPRRSHKSFPVR